jgi:hypothetical protein
MSIVSAAAATVSAFAFTSEPIDFDRCQYVLTLGGDGARWRRVEPIVVIVVEV